MTKAPSINTETVELATEVAELIVHAANEGLLDFEDLARLVLEDSAVWGTLCELAPSLEFADAWSDAATHVRMLAAAILRHAAF
jgi:hypothetical protein